MSTSAQLSPGFQSAWLGATIARPSMADILKMGRPQNKGSQTSCTPQDAVTPNSSLYCAKPSHVSATLQQEWHQDLHPQDLSKMLEAINESGASARQHVLNDECPVIEEPTANGGSSVADAPAASEAEISCNQSNSHDNRANFFRNCVSDAVRVLKGDVSENLSFDPVRCDSASSRQIIMNNAGGASDCDNFLLKDISSYGSHMAFELQEGSGSHLSFPNHSAPLTDDTNVDVSSTTATLHRLSLRNEEPAVPTTEDNCALVLPSHLQALAADCSQLSFGTYKASSNSSFSEPLGSNPSKLDWGKASVAIDGSYGHLDSRNSGHTGDEQLRSMYDTFTGAADARNYDLTVSSQSELMNHTIPEATVGRELLTNAFLSDSDFNNSQQPTSAFSFARADSQIRNLPAFSSELHSYSDTIQSDLFASTIKSLRDSDDLLHSPFPVTPSIPSLSKSAGSPLSSSTNSMLKVLNPAAFSNVQSSSVHPHRLYQPYTQANLTLEQLANGIRYPSLPRTQAYMTSAMDRGYPGNSASNQSLAGMNYSLPQYNSGAPSSRLPLPANASGYGNFGTHTNSGRFLHNPSTDLTISHGGYDEVLHSNYMGGNNFTPFQQDDGFSAWNYGPGSRTMSSVPDSTYYSLAERNQQINRYRFGQQNSQYHGAPGQQNSQHHGPPGYPDFSHS
ncbi:uncharacterized protein LOC132180691 isoform X2 [Corylus avellana]|nr:uncharacterized protein LOC132180691 isoform X2 [Corylus avellana]